jgi:hypothetical protein
MQFLRRSRRLAVVVAAWFMLWLGATVASPIVGDAGLQLVCSGSAFKLVQPGQDDTSAPSSAHFGQCPACVQPAAPAPATLALQVPAIRDASAPDVQPTAPRTRHAAAPPAARGPPSFS